MARPAAHVILTQVVQPGTAPVSFLVGWTSFVPFAEIDQTGSTAEVAVGVHRYPLTARRGLLPRDQPPLNWRAMLGDLMTQEIPDPLVEFQLFETGGCRSGSRSPKIFPLPCGPYLF